jgi:hypothetical protein
MQDDEPKPPAEDIDLVTLLLQIAAVIAIPCLLWQPGYDFLRPIVHSLFAPLWRAVGL